MFRNETNNTDDKEVVIEVSGSSSNVNPPQVSGSATASQASATATNESSSNPPGSRSKKQILFSSAARDTEVSLNDILGFTTPNTLSDVEEWKKRLARMNPYAVIAIGIGVWGCLIAIAATYGACTGSVGYRVMESNKWSVANVDYDRFVNASASGAAVLVAVYCPTMAKSLLSEQEAENSSSITNIVTLVSKSAGFGAVYALVGSAIKGLLEDGEHAAFVLTAGIAGSLVVSLIVASIVNVFMLICSPFIVRSLQEIQKDKETLPARQAQFAAQLLELQSTLTRNLQGVREALQQNPEDASLKKTEQLLAAQDRQLKAIEKKIKAQSQTEADVTTNSVRASLKA